MSRRSLCVLAVAIVALATVSSASAVSAQPVATNLDFPAAFTFAPDGTLFYGERMTGRIYTVDPATGARSLFYTVSNLVTAGEQGLLGLAVDPSFPARPYVYAFATRTTYSGAKNVIVRITTSRGRGSSAATAFTGPASFTHDGCRILFGPDRALYVVIGDNGRPANAQSLATYAGKVVRLAQSSYSARMTAKIVAYGIRNSFGLAFDPVTGRLWETDNGPECNDEVNLIDLTTRRNYGWGASATCSTPPNAPWNTNRDGPSPVVPAWWWATPPAVTGAAFCSSCGLGPESEGTLFVGAFNTGEIYRLVLDEARSGVVTSSVAYTHPHWVLSVEASPDGSLFFSTADAIYRLTG